jgi:hypothetical protein
MNGGGRQVLDTASAHPAQVRAVAIAGKWPASRLVVS